MKTIYYIGITNLANFEEAMRDPQPYLFKSLGACVSLQVAQRMIAKELLLDSGDTIEWLPQVNSKRHWYGILTSTTSPPPNKNMIRIFESYLYDETYLDD